MTVELLIEGIGGKSSPCASLRTRDSLANPYWCAITDVSSLCTTVELLIEGIRVNHPRVRHCKPFSTQKDYVTTSNDFTLCSFSPFLIAFHESKHFIFVCPVHEGYIFAFITTTTTTTWHHYICVKALVFLGRPFLALGDHYWRLRLD